MMFGRHFKQVIMRVFYFLSCSALFCGVTGRVMNSTGSPLQQSSDFSLSPAAEPSSSSGVHRVRRKRFISQQDMVAILDYHNQVRANVFPPAANMEFMVRDIIFHQDASTITVELNYCKTGQYITQQRKENIWLNND